MSPRAAWRLEALGFRHVYDYAPGKEDWAARGWEMHGEEDLIGTHLQTDVVTGDLDETIGALRARTAGTEWDQAIIVNEDRVVLGVVRSKSLDEASDDTKAKNVMEEGPSTWRASVPVEWMLRRMKEHEFSRAIVTTPDGVLLGVFEPENEPKGASES